MPGAACNMGQAIRCNQCVHMTSALQQSANAMAELLQSCRPWQTQMLYDASGRGGGVGNSPADRAAKEASLRRTAQERHWQDYIAGMQ